MKKIIAITFLFLAIISCNNDDSAPVTSANPNLLQKVIVNPGTGYEKHWNFYDNGLLKEIRKADGTLLESFEYDTNNNLTTNINYESGTPVIQTFTYDSNNYLITVNGNSLSLNTATNTYTTGIWGYSSEEGTASGYTATSINSEKLILNSIRHSTENSIDGTITTSETLVSCNYNNTNLTSFILNNGMIESSYTFDDKRNPLKNALLPICRATALGNSKWLESQYNSINNITTEHYSLEDPEHGTFDYEYNSNNLPITQITNYYYLGTLEGTTITKLYYYQGDSIP